MTNRENGVAPPRAQMKPTTAIVHGDRRIDNYAWMRDKQSPEVTAHLEAENAYTESIMEPTKQLQQSLYDEILGRIKQTDDTVPVRRGDYYYYSRQIEGQQYSIYCRKKGSLQASEDIILDVNELAKPHKFFSLGAFSVSDDHRYLAYSIDTTGFRDYTLQVVDLSTGKLSTENREHVKSVAWAADNKTMFFAVDDDTKRPYQIWRHSLGAAHSEDVELFEESDERFRVGVSRSRSEDYVFVLVSSHTATEVHYLEAATPEAKLSVIAPRRKDHEYTVDHKDDTFFIRTNDKGRNFRIATAPVANPGETSWKPFIDHRDDVMVEGHDVFADHYVLSEREGGLPHLRVSDYANKTTHRIAMPEPVYAVWGGSNPEFVTSTFRYSYHSLTAPSSVYDYDIGQRESVLKKETEVLGGYDRTRYAAERVFATAKDGTRIPISIVAKKGVPRDGSAPMLLVGYGSYGFPYPVAFSHARVSLLDRGFMIGVAHIRGGGEMGKKWHDDGRMFNKKNTFADFIAAAEHVVADKYTSSDKLVIQGGSAGGLLVGAVANMRPDLFRIVISQVPFVDVLNTMLDEDLPLTVGEFEEWGNPKIKDQYEYIKSYCPYTNISAQDYPTILVKTSLHDSQVMYWEPAKYVAKLRELRTNDNLLVFKINMAGGHGGSSGRYDKLREVAFDYAFMLQELAAN